MAGLSVLLHKHSEVYSSLHFFISTCTSAIELQKGFCARLEIWGVKDIQAITPQSNEVLLWHALPRAKLELRDRFEATTGSSGVVMREVMGLDEVDA